VISGVDRGNSKGEGEPDGVLLAYFEGRMLKFLTKSEAVQAGIADSDGKFTMGLPPANRPGLLKWLKAARSGLKPNTLTDHDGSKRELGSGKSWVVDEDGPGVFHRLLQVLRVDQAFEAGME
jgi:hypothetical protein